MTPNAGNSRQQRTAEARARRLLKQRTALGSLAFERLDLRRRAERLERVRARTRAAVEARRRAAEQLLPFEGDHNTTTAR